MRNCESPLNAALLRLSGSLDPPYTMMGLRLHNIQRQRHRQRQASSCLSFTAFFNALWPIIFFRLKWRLFAFFWLVTLIALVSLVMAGFRYIRKTAYWLILPYFIWLIYAAYLNLGFYLLNR